MQAPRRLDMPVDMPGGRIQPQERVDKLPPAAAEAEPEAAEPVERLSPAAMAVSVVPEAAHSATTFRLPAQNTPNPESLHRQLNIAEAQRM
jgi:hypothetical protein